jgi:GNAT superfamily N-acetyltransferase
MAEPRQVEEWRLERYRDGDESAVLELFATVFGKARSLEHWRWQFKDNPYGGPFTSMARRVRDNAVVGSYSVMPLMLNVCGKPVLACQSVDTAVHPEFRGQRIFEKTAVDCYEWCAASGLAAVVGFPNANSYPGFVRGLEWKRIVFPTHHVLRLSMALGLRRVLGAPVLASLFDAPYRLVMGMRLAGRLALQRRLAGGGVRFVTADAVPANYEPFWNAWRAQEYLSVWKDSKYLAWRYDRNPDQRFRYLCLERDGAIAAIAVATEIDGALVLCELMIGGRDVTLGRLLVGEVCAHARSRGLRAVTFLGHDAGITRDALEGFEHSVSYTNVFGGRSFVPGALAETLPHAVNWTVTFGDGDFV